MKKVIGKLSSVVLSGVSLLFFTFVSANFGEAWATASVSGDVEISVGITPSVAISIQSPNDDDPTCVAIGQNPKPSCARATVDSNTYSSSYSDVTVFTNNTSGYGLTVSAEEPNLVSSTDSNNVIPTGILSVNSDGTVPGGQNKWSFKTDGYIENWTAMSVSPITVVAYNAPTPTGNTTRVTYGISAGTNPAGSYETELVYTATVFDGENPDYEGDVAYMQGFTCGSIEEGETTTLMDRRDRKTYAVSKLADGLCWMTEDLKLGGDYDMQLTSTYSDVTSDFVLRAENTGTWCTTDDASCTDQSLMLKTGAPNGYLYNWYAATAGGGTYETESGMVESSICPKGWKPPHGGTGIGSFYSITQTYDTVAKLLDTPIPAFNFTGFRNGASVNFPDSGGYYWARSAVSASNANYFVFYGNVVNPQHSGNKYYGFALRCVSTL